MFSVDKDIDRFKLVAIAARRALEISRGSPVIADVNDKDINKPAVFALLEIGQDLIDLDKAELSIIRSFQSYEIQRKFASNIKSSFNNVEDDVCDLFLESMNANIADMSDYKGNESENKSEETIEAAEIDEEQDTEQVALAAEGDVKYEDVVFEDIR